MRVIWLNGTVGSGKSAVGRALAVRLPGARFLDGDDCAGPRQLPRGVRWRMALERLLAACAKARAERTLVIAYPLDRSGWRRVRRVCGRARRELLIITLAPPLGLTLRGRSGRRLSAAEQARAREMRGEGYHRRRFAALTLPNACPPPSRTAMRVVRWLYSTNSR